MSAVYAKEIQTQAHEHTVV